jgi:ribonuclease HII
MLLSFHTEGLLEAGTDEVGRGCLAGPVVAAAVILPPGYEHASLNDSKKMSQQARVTVTEDIRQRALAFAIGEASPQEIDRYNILQASILAMHRALDQLPLPFEHLLVDGHYFRKWKAIPHTCLVKGDSLYAPIAAASVLAKVHRDTLMTNLASLFPGYGWEKNMGYPTARHQKAIKQLGITEWHRKSFKVAGQQLVLF